MTRWIRLVMDEGSIAYVADTQGNRTLLANAIGCNLVPLERPSGGTVMVKADRILFALPEDEAMLRAFSQWHAELMSLSDELWPDENDTPSWL